MIIVEVVWSLASLLAPYYEVLKMAIPMALQLSTPPPLPWKRFSEPAPSFSPKRVKMDCDTETDARAAPRKEKRRPARIEIPRPPPCVGLDFGDVGRKEGLVDEGFEAAGGGYWLASRKGTRHAMEDGYGVMTSINGDPTQALFGVFDGHGGRAAVDFVCDRLGENIVAALAGLRDDGSLETAVAAGYLATDREFLSQGARSGACVATVLLRAGEIIAANVGDCRVVLSRNGVAAALTSDHRAGREDERTRIENSGGYVSCRNGAWRVQDSLAVSRAIGDASLKEWIISAPETARVQITRDCEFLIVASDGLWDRVSDQEAVDMVRVHEKSIQSCKALVDLASSRGSRDDITVMVIDLQGFRTRDFELESH